MGPTSHARLSPSSAERWIECPASVRLAALMPVPPESPYALEGTTAHALAEITASATLEKITPRQKAGRLAAWHKRYAPDLEARAEMQRHVDAYTAYLVEALQREPFSQLMLEQRLPTGIPDCWGTTDAAIISPRHVEIVDFKYGQGIRVEAEGNPQLRLYAIGALESLGDLLGDVETVYMTVFQPRLDNVSTAQMPASELRAWRDSILPIAESARKPGAKFGPSEAACRWCPASGHCAAQLAKVTAEDFSVDPDLLTPEEIGEALARLPLIKTWMAALETGALDRAYSGEAIPGWKVVMSGARRYIEQPDAVLDRLLSWTNPDGTTYDVEDLSKRTLKGIGDLEKLLGTELFDVLCGTFVGKTEGKPSLVPESDKRAAIDPNGEAAAAFKEES